MQRYVASCALVMGASLVLAWGAVAQQSALQITGMTFVDHIKAGMIEQDVYVEKKAGSGQVYRVTKEEADKYRDAPVYSTASPVHHHPFDQDKVGPYAKGQRLGVTLGEWLSATGTGSYTCRGGKGRLSASFRNLVPDGLYTMWYAFAAKPHMGCPDCPFATLDLPVGEPKGTQNIFRADGSGRAKFTASFSPCLQLSNGPVMAMLAIAYHSDDKTYGPGPGPMGSVAHVQLFTPMPEEQSWQAAMQ